MNTKNTVEERNSKWSPSSVEEALVGLDLSPMLPPSLKNIELKEALNGWLGEGQLSLGFDSAAILGISLRRFDF